MSWPRADEQGLQFAALGAGEAGVVGWPRRGEWRPAAQPVGEVGNGQPVALGGVVAVDHVEIAGHQKGRAARSGRQQQAGSLPGARPLLVNGRPSTASGRKRPIRRACACRAAGEADRSRPVAALRRPTAGRSASRPCAGNWRSTPVRRRCCQRDRAVRRRRNRRPGAVSGGDRTITLRFVPRWRAPALAACGAGLVLALGLLLVRVRVSDFTGRRPAAC